MQNNNEKMVEVSVNSDIGGDQVDATSLKRPESSTSGEISSLNVNLEACSGAEQPSPSRSPHTRSWTVPGAVYNTQSSI